MDCVQLLLGRGADPTLQNDEFKTAVQLAERGSPVREALEVAAAAWEQLEQQGGTEHQQQQQLGGVAVPQ